MRLRAAADYVVTYLALDQLDDIQRVRLFATSLLAVLATVFIATLCVDNPGWPVLLIRAVTEAGMIGGLADWFAVEALFRRPLGLPIPHTALLPTNQQRAARNVGQFFTEHFLDPAATSVRIQRMEPTRHAAEWLARGDNALIAARYLTSALEIVVRDANALRIRRGLRTKLTDIFVSATSDVELSGHVGPLLKSTIRQDTVDSVLAFIRDVFDDNRTGMVKLLQERSRWWIPSVVDHQAATMLVDGALSMIDSIREPGSKMRRDFDTALAAAIDRLSDDGTLDRVVSSGKSYLVETGAFNQLAETLAEQARDRVAAEVRASPEAFAASLSLFIRRVASRIASDAQTSADVDLAIADATKSILREYRPGIGAYITNIIASWDSADLVERFESAVGRDLQFIRINGSLLGGLIGGIIFALKAPFG